ncbi:hypothetical protein B7P43_G05480 [Cryptotermes secundus]|uniref:Peptidase S1 domain-containing protein n=1 Tax=Cryptotermes secundus TaxID=105785 RepID=A0A2J7R1I8_9NEOP|nr:mucin-22 [Cryptotermes secundus]XP_023706649.1 mucin-22 [Cryptotermes secundus]XP_023706650.1 mucin-22 [Cryptotermes secundus]PNF34696.1 hypothetical protein B7P43_G05480 [Cryptotermes secundus]PNF34697.1 hypothetical protein B7P43_G05480 [Cryptotermes secundus]
MRLPVFVLVSLLQLANCLPIVDPGLFVIMGVRSCRAGTGYCLLGLDCTLDEDFLPDDQGGHCDGLRSAFTPSAHFICCRYNAANRTIPPETLPLPVHLTDNDLAPFSDYSNTDSIGTGAEAYGASNSHESDQSNFVQSVEASGFETGSAGPMDPSHASWTLLPETDASSTAATETVTDNALSRTTNQEEVSVTETTEFDAQSNRYVTDINTTVQSVLGDDEPTSSEHDDTTRSGEKTTRTTITESSVTDFTTQMQDQSSSTNSGVKSSGDNVTSDINVTGDSSSKVRPIQSRVDFDGPLMMVLTDRGIVEARPSVVRAETEIVVHGDKVRHRDVEVQNLDFTPSNTVAQTADHENELSANFETWTTDVVAETLSPTGTATEAYPAVTVSEADSEGTGTSFVGDVVTTSLQPVHEPSVIPTNGTTASSESGEASIKLYGDTKLLLDFHPNSVADANELSGSQTKTSNSVQASELDNSLLYKATENLISRTQDSVVSKSESIEHIVSESVSANDRHVSGKEASIVTESSTQALYKDADGTGLQLTFSKLNSMDTESQPENSESEIPENILDMSEITNEIPVTIQTELSVHETVTILSENTVTPFGKSDDTETGRIAQTVREPSVRESDGVSVPRKEECSGDCNGNVVPTATEAEGVVSESTRSAESITEDFQNPDITEPYETDACMRPSVEEVERFSLQTEQFSASETFTEHSSSDGTQQLPEITTLPSDVEMTVSAKHTKISNTEESLSSSTANPTAGYQLRSGAHSENQEDTSFLNNISDPVPTSTVIHTEIVVTSEGPTVWPVVVDTVGNSGSPSASGTSKPSSTTPAVATTPETSKRSLLCGVAAARTFPGTQCWLVQFMNANSSVPVCVGSYLDASTIVTSAKCISRVFDMGVAQMTLVSAGGAVTSHTRIRDVVVHEEYRNHGAELLLNDIGLLRLHLPASRMPPAACALCLPTSDRDLLDRPCDGITLGQVKPKSLQPDAQIGSPMVCSGGVLAGIASYYNPGPVYTPVSDYVTWIQTNQKIHDNSDNEWK